MNLCTRLLVSLAALLLPHAAFAATHAKSSDEQFERAETVSDSDLDTMRGGAFTLGGVTYDFSYLAVVHQINQQYGVDQVTTTSFNASDVQSGNSLSSMQVIQNSLNNTSIAVQQQLDIVVTGLKARADLDGISSRVRAARLR